MLDNRAIYTTHADKIFDKRYNSPNSLRRYVHRVQYDSILKYIQPTESVIDIGCGEGVLSCLMAAKGAKVTGIDISEPNIAAAKELARRMGVEERVIFIVGDAENVPVADASFDVAVSCHVLEHLPHFEKGLSEIHRVTKGKAIVALPTLLNLCSIVQVGHGSFWEISKRSLVSFPIGLGRAVAHFFEEGVDEGYMGHAELTHIFRWPWIVRRKLMAGGFEIDKFEASTLATPFFSFPLTIIRQIDKLTGLPVFRNFGYGTTLVLHKR